MRVQLFWHHVFQICSMVASSIRIAFTDLVGLNANIVTSPATIREFFNLYWSQIFSVADIQRCVSRNHDQRASHLVWVPRNPYQRESCCILFSMISFYAHSKLQFNLSSSLLRWKKTTKCIPLDSSHTGICTWDISTS